MTLTLLHGLTSTENQLSVLVFASQHGVGARFSVDFSTGGTSESSL